MANDLVSSEQGREIQKIYEEHFSFWAREQLNEWIKNYDWERIGIFLLSNYRVEIYNAIN